jgi:hypothetical protein
MALLSAALLMAGYVLFTADAFAASTSFVGAFDPDDPNEVFLIEFSLVGTTDVIAQSYGFGGSSSAPGGTNAAGTAIGAGGFDTYLSLFSGTGTSATFLTSNDDGLCPPGAAGDGACADSTLQVDDLPTGSYTLALSVFANLSFAENLGAGTLGDGFIQLGTYIHLPSLTDRTSDYALDLEADGLTVIATRTIPGVATAVPEAASLVLVATAFVAQVALRQLRRRSTRRRTETR